jgi:four helix bundle protein
MGNMNKMEVWAEAKTLAVRVYKVSNKGKFIRDFSFRDQVRRSAISVPSNLAEGEESLFEKVSIKYFSIASASLAELRTQFEIARDIGYVNEQDFNELSISMELLAKRIKKLIQYRLKQLQTS